MSAVSDATSLRWSLPAAELVKRLLPSITLSAPEVPAWAPEVVGRINELAALPVVDRRGSVPLNVEDVLAALNFLARNMKNDTTPPWIGRLSTGGLQLAWTRGDVEVEAVFDSARDEAEVLVSVAENEWDAPAQDAESLFAQVVDRLSLSHLGYAAG